MLKLSETLSHETVQRVVLYKYATGDVFKWLGVNHTPSTSHRPQSNGQVERLNQTLKNTLRKQCKEDTKNWDKYLWKTLLIIRTLVSKSTGYSPAHLRFGFQPQLVSTWSYNGDIDIEEELIYNRIKLINDYLPELRNLSHQNNIEAKKQDEKFYNKKVKNLYFKIDDLVLKFIDSGTEKFDKVWEGPYKILQKLSKGAYVIGDENGNCELCNGDNLKSYDNSRYMIPQVTNNLKTKLRRYKTVPDRSIRA
ncbi:Transposon Ty3-G Gag-Pol polyprotein [Zancudomyces culisetae]|uniref:Transposon Ty3-G Gag-Pol polyprotein n=1 Tax=Zancudomyces culisetae TaxID=1213189 RepID=A0A1R1PF92_ZANCU|nr:Transposon Ty3-G Gag-Pol polyprotein [Zancudomyces culisetae]|eukprot:OMH79670.1 Transposon Ty3-G Gag-Pol polyprotein [Zancudomyces culisetae]